MNKWIAGSVMAAALGLCASNPAQASDNIDFGAITCKTFLTDVAAASEDDVAGMMLWLDGYLSGVSGDAVMRFDAMEAFGENLVAHCSKRGNDKLLDAARKVGLQ